MIETMVEYRVEKQVGVKWVNCPDCQASIGYEVNGGEYLLVGKLKVKSMRANCIKCGAMIWWYNTDKMIERIAPSPTE